MPAIDAAVAAEGKVRLLAQFEDFHGWDMHAAWDDFRLGMKHYGDFEPIAMVGDRKWQAWLPACANRSPRPRSGIGPLRKGCGLELDRRRLKPGGARRDIFLYPRRFTPEGEVLLAQAFTPRKI